MWQGFPDPKWHLGPLVTQQIEKNLEYELKRAGAILRYMDDRDAKLQKMKESRIMKQPSVNNFDACKLNKCPKVI